MVCCCAGTLPSGWSAAPDTLATIDLSNNTLSGSLPKVCCCVSLQTVFVCLREVSISCVVGWSCFRTAPAPKLYCVVPVTCPFNQVWSNLTSLSYLDLSFNELVGELPLEWGRLTNLTTL